MAALAVLGWLGCAGAAQAQTSYYAATNGASIYPYTNWTMAATQLQMVVDASTVGSTIWVSNGVWNTGGKVAGGSTLTNRVSITKAITISSVNGPAVTTIAGSGPFTYNGASPIRCVYMSAGNLFGFTLTNGATRASATLANGGGGGVYSSTSATISNCIIRGNTAYDGGGVCNGMVYNSTIEGNVAFDLGGGAASQFGSAFSYRDCTIANNVSLTAGGGAVGGRLFNCIVASNAAMTLGGGTYLSTNQSCTISGNWAEEGGGVYSGYVENCTMVDNTASSRGGGYVGGNAANCIIYYNHAQEERYANYFSAPIYLNVCTWPMPPVGSGNITNNPLIASVDNPRLLPGSPCYNSGYYYSWMTNAYDVEGNDRLIDGAVDIGAYEFAGAASLTGSLTAEIGVVHTQVVAGTSLDFAVRSSGKVQQVVWNFGDGTLVTNDCVISHSWASAGTYDVTLQATNQSGQTTVTTRVGVVSSADYYVKPTGSDASAGTSWATAKLTIQAAVNAAPVGATVWVTNGTYATGGQTAGNQLLTNRVAVTKPMTVRSMGGPAVTVISGFGPYAASNAVRCVYLAEGATLSGFALTNGCTFGTPSLYAIRPASARWGGSDGGGLYAPSFGVVVTNCIIGGSNSAVRGGGGYGGSYYNCTVANNQTPDATGLGGGIYYGQLFDGTISGNWAGSYGGGAYLGQYSNSTFSSNAAIYGGGAATGTLFFCSMFGNTATNQGGGAWGCQLENCSIVSNRTISGTLSTYGGGGIYGSLANGCDVAYNVAAASGGGIYSGLGSNCTLRFNVAGNQGGGIYNPTTGFAVTNYAMYGNVALSNGGGSALGNYYNCSIVSNRAGGLGGGGYQSGSYYNCEFIENSATEAGGLYQAGDSYNCTIVGNTALLRGGGVVRASGTLYNSIVYYNTAQFNENAYGVSWSYGCTVPLPATPNNTITNEPLIASVGHPQLLSGSPCTNAGLNQGFMGGMRDLAGTNRILFSTVDMGAYEFAGDDTLTGSLTVAIGAASTQVVVGASVEFAGHVEGQAQTLAWNFADGSTLTNQCNAEHAWSSPGTYALTLTASNVDGSATATVQIEVVESSACYVALSGDDANSGATWLAPKQTIQAAVDAAIFGGTVWVSNGVYDTGAQVAGEQETSNRVVVSRGVTVRSANGPEVTTIAGSGPAGPAAVRGVYLAAGASLVGFTVTNGAVSTNLSSFIPGFNGGGGIFCEANTCVVSNCVVVGNQATVGGGVLGGSVYNCLVAGNVASNAATTNCFGGGTYYSHVYDSVLSNNVARSGGGGAYGTTLANSTIVNNSALNGGGTYAGTLSDSLLAGNVAWTNGGGCFTSVLVRCTISNNTSARYGGGVSYGVLSNCVVADNTSAYQGGGAYKARLLDCSILNNRANEGGGIHSGADYTFYATNCLIVGNSATNGNGGGVHGYGIDSCIVVSNTATTNGGAQMNNHCLNSLLAYNTAGAYGGGYYNQSGTAWKLRNCTIVSNTAVSNGGGVYMSGTVQTMTNCVLWGNAAPVGTNWGANIASSKTNINFTCTTPLPVGRTGNIESDPLFVDGANGDFRLGSGSPCINMGTNETWMETATDLDGNPRIAAEIVDMGAYEVQSGGGASIAVLGTNGAVVANGESASSEKGTDFGSLPWGQSRTNIFSITNGGSVDLTINDVATNGAGADSFTVLHLPTTVAAGTVSNFSVSFSPTAVQTYTCVVAISNSSPDTLYNLCLSGTGAKQDQTIIFQAIGDKVTTDAVGLAATADSGLPVSFAVCSGPASISGGTNLTFSGPGTVSIVASQGGGGNWNAAPEVTNTFQVFQQYTLTIEPSLGTPDPAVGVYTNLEGTVLTNTVAEPIPADGIQYVCTGWTLAGNEPSSGSGTEVVMTVTNDAVLTWLWTTNYWLDTAAGAHGSVNVADGWQAADVTTQLKATADAFFHFTGWTGDAAGTDNPLDLLIDAPKTVTAGFAATLTTNQPTPEWWLDEMGITNDFEEAVGEDPDEDGVPTWKEFVMDTDPMDSNSYLRVAWSYPAYGNCTELVTTNADPYEVVTQTVCDVTGYILNWPCSIRRVYDVETKVDIRSEIWTPLSGWTNIVPDSGTLTITNLYDPAMWRYFRLQVRVPE